MAEQNVENRVKIRKIIAFSALTLLVGRHEKTFGL